MLLVLCTFVFFVVYRQLTDEEMSFQIQKGFTKNELTTVENQH